MSLQRTTFSVTIFVIFTSGKKPLGEYKNAIIGEKGKTIRRRKESTRIS